MIAELTNHIWQSTVFAVAIAGITLAFRRNRAKVRYWLWLSASFKFLLPFSLLMMLGHWLEPASSTSTMGVTSSVRLAVAQVSQPFSQVAWQTTEAQPGPDWPAVVILGVWACGFLGLTFLRLREWLRIRAAVSSSAPMTVLGTVQVRSILPSRSCPGLLEPGIVGLFHPILLLPADITDRLSPSQLNAVLAHELSHVRRRDNLTSAIHMIVETIFWFHPLVWWIGARLLEERELACDESVLSLGNEPLDYAEGILTICKSYVESPLAMVSGVTGSDLKKRIHAILNARLTGDLNFAKKLSLAAIGIAAMTVPVAIGMIAVPAVQTHIATPKFVTASIKTCEVFRRANLQDLSPENFESECTTTQRFIEQAYGLFSTGHLNPGSSLGVAGSPAWTESNLYQIDAKSNSPQTHAMLNGPMLQTLLEQRFKLRLHRETRKMPVYALTVVAGGTKLQRFQGSCTPRDFDKSPSDADCGTSRAWGNGFHIKGATLADLCTGLSVFLDRHVVDRTGIAGRFNIPVDLPAEDRGLLNRPHSLAAESNPTAPTSSIPVNDVRIALKQLGLNLEPAEAPMDFVVIDHIEKPLTR